MFNDICPLCGCKMREILGEYHCQNKTCSFHYAIMRNGEAYEKKA